MKKLTPYLFIILFFLLFFSCNKSILFDEKVVFTNTNWTFENKEIFYKGTLQNSKKPYAIILELTLTESLNVDMFYATFSIISPAGGNTVKSIVFNFKNPQEPYIQGNTPNEKIYKMIVYPKRFFSETGDYTFIVNQRSSKADNYGIKSLRMYIKQVKE